MRSEISRLATLLVVGFLMHEAGSVVRAAPVSGVVSFSGGVTVDNNNLTLATRFTSFAGVTVAQAPTGDYSGLTPGLTVAMTPFSFSPFPAQVAPLWQCSQGGATYSFDLTTLHVDYRSTRSLFLSGTGVAHITGYDDTPGTWSFSMQGSTSFSFNATTTTPGWLGDWVWDDLNQNGIQDVGEPGIPGVTVTLTKPGGATETTVTDADGYYYFVNLAHGGYSVAVSTPDGYLPSPCLIGVDRSVDSDLSGVTVTLAPNHVADDTLDFGFYRPTGAIGDFIWKDLNQNGIQDAGEPGINGVTVWLTNPAAPGTVLATAVTTGNGGYLFSGLTAGTYQVAADTSSPVLAGFVPTFSEAPLSTPADDSNATPLTVTLPTDNFQDLSADFGFIPTPPGTIGDYVWYDRNNNNLQDAPGSPDFEPGIQGVSVQLINLDASGEPVIETQITDGFGYYLFGGLPPGHYRVLVDNSQPILSAGGYLPSIPPPSPPPGGTAANDSNLNPWDVTLVLTPASVPGGIASTSSDTSVDFGYYRLASLAGYVYLDTNNDGLLQDAEARLASVTVALTGTDDHNQPVILTTQTDSTGFYRFGDLRPGNYVISETQPATYLDGKDTIGTQGGTTANDVFSEVLLGFGVDGINNNFGELPPSRLSGTVYLDGNDNGVQDDSEPGIAGVAVALQGTSDLGAVLETTSTDADGCYAFTGLRPGLYAITESQPAPYLDGKDAVGTQGGSLGNDFISNITVPPTSVNGVENNFGELPMPPDISLVKTADPQVVAPYKPVTYSYTVTNTGGTPLTTIVVKDDNGTPAYPGDDFIVGTIASLAPGESATLTAQIIPVVSTVSVVNGATVNAGAIIVVTMLADGDIQVTYLQDFGINDNTYGTGAIGWPNGHKFGDLVGSDKLEFRFFDKSGNVAIDFYLDSITAASKVTLPGTGQVITYPSGYGTLGPFGGDGFMVAGNPNHLLSFSTSISDNLNRAANLPNKTALIVNSPTSLVGGQIVIDTVKAPGGWNHINSYTAVVSADAFAAGGGFGSVSVPDQHNSPNKLGGPHGIVTTPVNSEVTNTATATAGTLSATATATVKIVVPPEPVPPTLAVTEKKFDNKAKQLRVTIANTGTTDVILSEVALTWPAANGKMTKVALDGDVVYDTPDIAAPTATLTTAQMVKDAGKRTIQKGSSDVFIVTFEKAPNATWSNYSGQLTFTNGATLVIP